jgi:glucose-6-phosphate 1-epimerase
LSYLDKLRDFNAFTQDEAWTFEGACDRIYLRAGAHQRIDDPVLRRSLHIESAHSASAVVWNPGAEGIAALGDVPLKDWYQYVCVEAGNCAPLDRVSLAPGATAVIGQRISAAPLHPSATTF